MFSYYSALTHITLFSQIIMLSIISSDHLLPKESKTYFKLATITIIALALTEWTATYISINNPSNEMLMSILLFIMQILSPLLPLIVGRVFKKYSHMNMIYGLVFGNIILHTLTISKYIYISPNNILSLGNIYIFDDLIFIICLILMSWNIYSFCKNYQSINAYILILTVAIVIYSNFLRTLHPDYRVVWFAGTAGLIFVYAFYSALINKIDSLTYVLNRRCYESRFSNLNKDSYIVLIDLNKFKEINDTYGHSFGDYILKEIADIIQKTYVKQGTCFRIGGDEFCVIAKVANYDIESLNKQVNDAILEGRKQEPLLPLVAIGYGKYIYGVNTQEEAFEEADAMMYKSKGKNRKKV